MDTSFFRRQRHLVARQREAVARDDPSGSDEVLNHEIEDRGRCSSEQLVTRLLARKARDKGVEVISWKRFFTRMGYSPSKLPSNSSGRAGNGTGGMVRVP